MPNHKELLVEPDDHAIGRSRGDLSTKVHPLCNGNGLPMVVLLGPGQGTDSRMYTNLLDAVRVPRVGTRRPRTTPTAAGLDSEPATLEDAVLVRVDERDYFQCWRSSPAPKKNAAVFKISLARRN